jgi:hypothetical protein
MEMTAPDDQRRRTYGNKNIFFTRRSRFDMQVALTM